MIEDKQHSDILLNTVRALQEKSTDPRANAAHYYRSELVGAPIAASDIEGIADVEANRPWFYGTIAKLSNVALRETIKSQADSEHFRLIDATGRVHTGARNAYSLGRLLQSTLEHDIEQIVHNEEGLVYYLDTMIESMRRYDVTMHSDTMTTLRSGALTSVDAMQMTYTVLERESIARSESEFAIAWRTVFEQMRLSIQELVSLPVHGKAEAQSVLFEVDESNVARFCRHALVIGESADKQPNFAPIGCPISFEPKLVIQMWEWYVKLRAQIPSK